MKILTYRQTVQTEYNERKRYQLEADDQKYQFYHRVFGSAAFLILYLIKFIKRAVIVWLLLYVLFGPVHGTEINVTQTVQTVQIINNCFELPATGPKF